jgi:hypothetical protein
LIEHHIQRADEVVDILGEGPLNAYDIASRMTWDLTIKNFEEFPIMQKWFAMGEALAHIRFLETGGKVERIEQNETYEYRVL